MTGQYQYEGMWKVRNGMLFVVHVNPAATKGDREIRYRGHSVDYDKQHRGILFELVGIWNENAQCVSVQGVVDDVTNYDLVDRVRGETAGAKMYRLLGCRECMGV